MQIEEIHNVIKRKLQGGLPGERVQNLMAPSDRNNKVLVPETYRNAAVLGLIYPSESGLHMAYIRRSAKDKRDKHAGQIGFPGGKYEQFDSSFMETALRETHEEIGVDPAQIQIITPLTELYVPVSNFLIHPFLGVTHSRPEFCIQEEEVDAVLEVPLRCLSEGYRKKKDIYVRNICLREVPIYSIADEVVWGATAMITREIENLIQT